ncbi:unnamed protein product [Closterium sp. NIES-53]
MEEREKAGFAIRDLEEKQRLLREHLGQRQQQLASQQSQSHQPIQSSQSAPAAQSYQILDRDASDGSTVPLVHHQPQQQQGVPPTPLNQQASRPQSNQSQPSHRPPSPSPSTKQRQQRLDMWDQRKPLLVLGGVAIATALACYFLPSSLRPIIFAAAALAVTQLLSSPSSEDDKTAVGAAGGSAGGGLAPLPPPAIPLFNSSSSPPLGSLQEKSALAGALDTGAAAADGSAGAQPGGEAAVPPAFATTAAAPSAAAAEAAPAPAASAVSAGNPAAEAAADGGDAAADGTAAYLASQGISPGARAMAAAMKAKATRAAARAAAAPITVAEGTAEGPKRPEGMVVLYGSQTGNAMEIAKTINAEAQQRGLPSHVHALNDYSLEKLRGVAVAVVVVSSTGDGDPPENCDRFIGALQRRSLSPSLLSHLKYTVCGLGDSNYTRYMAVPRVFSRRLPELGAHLLCKCCEADEVDGLEEVVEAWTASIWGSIQDALAAPAPLPAALEEGGEGGQKAGQGAQGQGQQEEEVKLVGVPPLQACRVRLVWLDGEKPDADTTTATAATAATATPPFSHSNLLRAPVVAARFLSAEWSERVVVHVEVDVSTAVHAGVSIAAGDSVGVVSSNDAAMVEQLLARLGVDGERVFSLVDAESTETGASAGSAASAGSGAVARAAAASSRDGGHIPARCTLRHALLHCCDVKGTPKKGLLRILADYCSDRKEQQRLLFLSSRGGKDAYKELVMERRPSLLELLLAFPSCQPDLAHLLDALPPLVARFYSLSSSPLASDPPGTSVSFAFSLVHMPLKPLLPELMPAAAGAVGDGSDGAAAAAGLAGQRVFEGVCTSWLEQSLPFAPEDRERVAKRKQQQLQQVGAAAAAAGADAPCLPPPVPALSIFPKPGGRFSHPASLSAPLIMIGPGTGVAPFRGFLQERRRLIARNKGEGEGEGGGAGESWLFFGCRREDEDYLYREDFEGFVADGTLSQLDVAFSRAGKDKVYVQHKMQARAEELAPLLLNPATYVFICGDGAGMVKDVHAALQSILQAHGGMAAPSAAAHLQDMMGAGRYVRDVWS